jgi:hypothetical protein
MQPVEPNAWTGTIFDSHGLKLFNFQSQLRSGSMIPIMANHSRLDCVQIIDLAKRFQSVQSLLDREPAGYSVTVLSIEPANDEEKHAFENYILYLALERNTENFNIEGVPFHKDHRFFFYPVKKEDKIPTTSQLLKFEPMSFINTLKRKGHMLFCIIGRSIELKVHSGGE